MRVKDIPKEWNLPLLTLDQILNLYKMNESYIPLHESISPLTILHNQEYISGEIVVFQNSIEQIEHVGFFYPSYKHLCETENPLIRLHSECLTGNVYGSVHCDCKEQFDIALR